MDNITKFFEQRHITLMLVQVCMQQITPNIHHITQQQQKLKTTTLPNCQYSPSKYSSKYQIQAPKS